MKRKLKILLVLLAISCVDEPNYLHLGIESFEKRNYTLAENQFKMIKSSEIDYQTAKEYLRKIDSIIYHKTLINKEKDSIRTIDIKNQIKAHIGNYKVDVVGTTMDKSVEVYSLKANGVSVWRWVNYIGGLPFTDKSKTGTWWLDTEGSITIRIQGDSGVANEKFFKINGQFVETQLKNRKLIRTQEKFK